MTFLSQLLESDPLKLALMALVLMVAVPVLLLVLVVLRRKGLPTLPLSGLLVPRREDETLTPVAQKYLDGRIEHKLNNVLAGPALAWSTPVAELRKDVDRLDDAREEMQRDLAVIKERTATMDRKLDQLIERRGS